MGRYAIKRWAGSRCKMVLILGILFLYFAQTTKAQSISFSPDTGQPGASFAVTITGVNTQFGIISSTCIRIMTLPTPIEMTDVNVVSPSEMQATLSIPCESQLGIYDGQVLNQTCDSLAVSCLQCFAVAGSPLLTVTTTAGSGFGSLRSKIGCSSSGDTIRFDQGLENQTILLESPPIAVNHDLVLFSDFNLGVTISNASAANTNSLLDLSDQMTSHGLTWSGQSASSFIVDVLAGGSLVVQDSELSQINIRKP